MDDPLEQLMAGLRYTGPTCWLYEHGVPYPVARWLGKQVAWLLNVWEKNRSNRMNAFPMHIKNKDLIVGFLEQFDAADDVIGWEAAFERLLRGEAVLLHQVDHHDLVDAMLELGYDVVDLADEEMLQGGEK